MKRTIPFELFEKNQYLYFDIQRLAELENAFGTSIISILNKQEAGVNFCLQGLLVGLKHHYYKAVPTEYMAKMEKYLEGGGTLNEIAVPIIRAIIASGILGKDAAKIASQASADEAGKNE